jgi:DNA-binding response OmpR family regulator
MADTTTLNAPVCLVSRDGALVHLITTEAQEMALPLMVAKTLTDALGQRPEALLLDLDDTEVLEKISALSDTISMIGICRAPDALPSWVMDRLQDCLARPFPTAILRAYMSRFGGRPVFAEGWGYERYQTPAPDGAPTREVSLSMEGESALRVGNALVELTPKEAALMRCLLDHRGEIVGRDALSEALQSMGRESTDSNKTEVYLCFLRRKIERPLGIRLITTVRGKGYRLE